MTNTSYFRTPSYSRQRMVDLLNAALTAGAARFARQAALSWIGNYPGDLYINLLYARALSQTEGTQQALPLLENICLVDPEYLEAQELLAQIRQTAGVEPDQVNLACLYALEKEVQHQFSLPDWAHPLRHARQAMNEGDLEKAEGFIHHALLSEPLTPIVAVTHVQVSARSLLPSGALLDLASHYHLRWPSCVLFKLVLADTLMSGGEPEKAVSLLHQAVTLDVPGQVATRLWGSDHPYRNLWPENLAAPLETPVPAEVAVLLQWNRLPGGDAILESIQEVNDVSLAETQETTISPDGNDKASPEDESTQEDPVEEPRQALPPYTVPDTLKPIQEDLARLATRLKRKHLARADGRFPIYVVFTTRKGLVSRYGNQAPEIETAMKRVVDAVSARRDWNAVLVYADDPKSMAAFGLQPAQAKDPWSLKLALADLDSALASRGEMIGAVLIVGGPEIVPFHHLPNPVDDDDIDVPSDNPYTTRDENYFVQEWMIGRIPGGSQESAETLITELGKITDRHTHISRRTGWPRRIAIQLASWFWRRLRGVRPSLGYTAAIWRRSAQFVYRLIGDPQTMLVSPPIQVNGSRRRSIIPPARLGYFNLHGLSDSSEWYGQRDPAGSSGDPDYPVALRTQDVINGGRASQVVFSEACYGAHIMGKAVDEALSLKFLASGSQVVVGSTCTAYGSITPPLVGADLLGHAFLKYLKEGFAAGEALRKAKIQLAREMIHRQGYLDGEDQKTLISFVLYGDPLATLVEFSPRSKGFYRGLEHPTSIPIVCERSPDSEGCQPVQQQPPLPEDTLIYVRRVVEQYLPGMSDAQMAYRQTNFSFHGEGHTTPSQKGKRKSGRDGTLERKVVTLSKQVTIAKNGPESEQIHPHYARLTLDRNGKIIKMAVSR